MNIENATFELRSARVPNDFPTDVELRDLHRRMSGDVWKWAGTYRHSDKNIGVPWPTIPEHMRNLCADTHARADDEDPDELSAWFHWRLVAIHAFPNGNGRHARAATDRLRRCLGLKAWTWGEASIDQEGEVRRQYIDALKAADKGDLKPLLAFVSAV